MTNIVDLRDYTKREAQLDLSMSMWGAALWAAIHDQGRIPEPHEAKTLIMQLSFYLGDVDGAVIRQAVNQLDPPGAA